MIGFHLFRTKTEHTSHFKQLFRLLYKHSKPESMKSVIAFSYCKHGMLSRVHLIQNTLTRILMTNTHITMTSLSSIPDTGHVQHIHTLNTEVQSLSYKIYVYLLTPCYMYMLNSTWSTTCTCWTLHDQLHVQMGILVFRNPLLSSFHELLEGHPY